MEGLEQSVIQHSCLIHQNYPGHFYQLCKLCLDRDPKLAVIREGEWGLEAGVKGAALKEVSGCLTQ